jgi:hypothetical protein
MMMDNAKYHLDSELECGLSRLTKEQRREWLTQHKVTWSDEELHNELYQKAQLYCTPKKKIEDIS